jgi:FkbM family methyltransferase
MVVIDAGAHRGYYTLLASSILGNEGKVISFEPSPRERRWLGLHVKINGRKNVVIEKSALGSKEGAAEFYLSLGHQTGCSSLRPPKGVKYNLPVKVPVVSLDQYSSVSGIPRIDFMKIDVEGAERDVILGGRNRLTRDRPIVLCELSDLRTLRWNYRPVETVKLLEKLDYHCYLIQPDGSLADHREKAVYEDNVLAIPNEKLNALPKGRA